MKDHLETIKNVRPVHPVIADVLLLLKDRNRHETTAGAGTRDSIRNVTQATAGETGVRGECGYRSSRLTSFENQLSKPQNVLGG
jgi:hypothetical protein